MNHYFIIINTQLYQKGIQRNNSTDVVSLDCESDAFEYINKEYDRIRKSDLCRVVNYSSCSTNFLICNMLEYNEIIADTDNVKRVRMILTKEVG